MSYPTPLMETPADPYAGFWMRFGAGVVDVMITLVPTVLILLLLPINAFVVSEGYYPEEKIYAFSGLGSFAYGVVLLVYKVALESGRRQATFGKRAFKLVVTDLTGQQISPRTAALRSWPIWLPFLLPIATLNMFLFVAALISCIAVGMTKQKQGFHDILAECLVVRRGATFKSVDA